MGMEVKLQQRWEFRRKDNDSDSSSSDSKSILEPALKKNKVVSSLVAVDDDETSDSSRFQQEDNNNPGDSCVVVSGEAGKRQRGSRRRSQSHKEKKTSPRKKVNATKSKTGIYEQAALDDLKTYMHSLLEDLKVSRENLLTWMREEMQKLAAEGNCSEPERRESSTAGKNVQFQNQDKCEGNLKVQHQNNFQSSTQVQHPNNFEKYGSAQQRSKFKEGGHLQHHTNLEEKNEALQKSSLENPNLQHYNPFRSCLRSQDWKVGPSESIGMVNRSHDSSKFSLPFDEQVDYSKAIVPLTSSENCNSNCQAGSSTQNVQVQRQKGIVLGITAQNGKATKGKRTTDSNNHRSASESRVGSTHASGSMESAEKGKEEKLGLAIDPYLPSDSYNSALPSSMYLTLPSVLTNPQVSSNRFDSSLFNSIQPIVYGNQATASAERFNGILGSSSHTAYFQGMRPAERSRNVAATGFRDPSYFNQTSTVPALNGSGFTLPLHQPVNGSLSSIAGQVGLQNLLAGNNNRFGGTWMNGGAIRFSGGSYSLPEQYIPNNLINLSNYAADGRLMPIQDNFQFPK
ncbi:hypothetical protein Tsubulata_018113 [Turnera subulata]|uniref:Uncharacterized protein n=1 Tax=Turnera subulata TaxID=218843 RepID=A0A9Q0FI53_9ROSI|nr:hypothetical protein Tsubulata_018113 [Turnera subulata]